MAGAHTILLLLETGIPFAPHISQLLRPSIQSCLLLNSFWASLVHSLTMWLIISLALTHILPQNGINENIGHIK